MTPAYRTICAPRTVYRVTRSSDALRLPPWESLKAAERGRYDDPLDVFRVLYTSTSKVGALTEVLADLRPKLDTVLEPGSIGGDNRGPDLVDDVIRRAAASMKDRFTGRYLATIVVKDRGPVFVDLAAGISRGQIEHRLGTERLKTGQFIGRDRVLARYAARVIASDLAIGLVSRSFSGRGGRRR
jgi:hypothetical protein